MFLGYKLNNTGGTYHMLNIHIKPVALSREIIRMKEKYGKLLPRLQYKKVGYYSLQYKEDYNKQHDVKFDTIKSEKVKTEQYHREEE